jgi:hypothetical protein
MHSILPGDEQDWDGGGDDHKKCSMCLVSALLEITNEIRRIYKSCLVSALLEIAN